MLRTAFAIGLCIVACACTSRPVTEHIATFDQQAAARATRIRVPVMVNGQGPFEFMLDTGATHAVVSSSLAEKLALPLNELAPVRVRSVSGVFAAPRVHVQSVQAGELQLESINAPVLSGPVMDGVDGILGVQGMRDKAVRADFERDAVTIVATDADSAGNGNDDLPHAVLGFDTLARHFISVDARVNGLRVTAVIDTGGGQTLGNPALLQLLLQRNGGKPLLGYRSSVIDASATSQATVLLPIQHLALGEVEIRQLPVSFGDFSVFKFWALQDRPALVVAMDALSQLSKLTIDYRRKQLHLQTHLHTQPSETSRQ